MILKLYASEIIHIDVNNICVSCKVSRRRHGVDWGELVPPISHRGQFSNFSKSDEKGGGGGYGSGIKSRNIGLGKFLYPDCLKSLKIVATLPVTVASCAPTHSNVKIISNYLRVSMSPDRLEDLVQISSERDIANNIELSKLVEIIKLAKLRKLPL